MLEELATIHPMLPAVVGSLTVLLGAALADLVTRRLLLAALRAVAKRTKHRWDDALVEHGFFARLAQIAPAIVIYFGIGYVPDYPEAVERVVRNVVSAYMIVSLTLAVAAATSAVNAIYESLPGARRRPVKGLLQLAQIGVYILGAILVVAALIDRSPVILLSGLGALTAVLLIVFRDTLLSLVASLQLSSQDLVRVGDWLEMPQFGADGDVIDVALYTVTVQNWDKTLTTIPTYRLISDSFKNWRGMTQSGGASSARSTST